MAISTIVHLKEMELVPQDEAISVGRPDWELAVASPQVEQQIDVRLIRVRGQARTTKHTDDQIRSLADELMMGPLRNAIHVRRDPEDPEVPCLLHGEGRVRAWLLRLKYLLESGQSPIDYRITARLRTEKKGEHDWLLEQGLDNDQSAAMDPFDLARSYRQWIYDPSHGADPVGSELTKRIGQLSLRTGKSRAVIESRLRLLVLCPLVCEHVAAGRIELSDASQIGRILSSDAQVRMATRVLTEKGMKGNALVAAVTELLSKPQAAAPTGNGTATKRSGQVRAPRPLKGREVTVKAAGYAKGVPGERGFIGVKVFANTELPPDEVIRQLKHLLEGLEGGKVLQWDDEPAVGFE